MAELSVINTLASLGVGCVLGAMIFLMYRRDRRDTEQRWREMCKDLITVRQKETDSRDKNTAALTELNVLIRRLNGKAASG